MRFFDSFCAFIVCRRGATAIEYGLIAALVIVVMLVALTSFGNSTTAMFDRISAKFPKA
jgi:pilus assembly protein Flp/PilA